MNNVWMCNTDVEKQGGSRRDGFHRHGCFRKANGVGGSSVRRRVQMKRDDNSGRRGVECVCGGSEGKVFPELGK